ncbi:DEHA2G01166p [Debaryomyces hansenii CBS767]|uniref:DEHA2G01166p n=1 Tax=Debaryomyces hansenii (strain ATCC 36239 / CBS 767 / BCRC 21394 / JCM 1990 / NBRC 0083 / IGC 2968) TaxID=284592 RepID=B5RV10_DEBHA|nr:DEHA2G01166p [Debaryomyces hansenii CBS767]CAR65889.1 DEHA2G01166p [Debaryomyces hansenii CBS767]|eukprot:XP_002770554.1 DEHA2G01166p [Debaryomyces hansenii CBS767]
MTSHVDYTLYLVTDSTMIPEGSTFLKQVEHSINNGATMVQLREKTLSTLDFIERASQVHELTLKRGIPLIINDRVDVALAIDAEGVHVGQDDMPASIVRKLVGPNKIVGVSCSFPSEVEAVCKEGLADYVGLGTVYKTNTKTNVSVPQGTGTIGVRKMLQVLKAHNAAQVNNYISSVAIGGINESNASKVLYQSAIPGQSLDGVAVVSCIMASKNAAESTIKLENVIKSSVPWVKDLTNESLCQTTDVKIKAVVRSKPLIHHITNNVVKNFSANVTLSIGASPIMSELPDEFEEFTSSIPNLALVLNLGTPSTSQMDVFKHAISVYNKHGKHIIFDPVAAGASSPRLECCKELLNAGQFSVIKGNVGEISAIWKLTSKYQVSETGKNDLLMRGVDSVAEFNESDILRIGKEVAQDFRAIVVITGAKNFVFDGICVSKDSQNIHDASSPNNVDDIKHTQIKGGHEVMSSITGTGCSLGSTIAAFVAANADGNSGTTFNIFEAVVGAVEFYNKCGSEVGQDVTGPGSFMIRFLDRLNYEAHAIK